MVENDLIIKVLSGAAAGYSTNWLVLNKVYQNNPFWGKSTLEGNYSCLPEFISSNWLNLINGSSDYHKCFNNPERFPAQKKLYSSFSNTIKTLSASSYLQAIDKSESEKINKKLSGFISSSIKDYSFSNFEPVLEKIPLNSILGSESIDSINNIFFDVNCVVFLSILSSIG